MRFVSGSQFGLSCSLAGGAVAVALLLNALDAGSPGRAAAAPERPAVRPVAAPVKAAPVRRTRPAPVSAPARGRLVDATLLGRGAVRASRMRHRFAEWALRSHGIRWRSNGKCADRRRRDCTSFEGMRWGTLATVAGLRRASGCALTVSGGTERGHAPGRFSHERGYKIDIMPGRCPDRYITRAFRHVGKRTGDRAALYRSPGGVVFARESDHWDITVP